MHRRLGSLIRRLLGSERNPSDRGPLREAAEDIVRRRQVVALTGAGISVDSGIPDFRSAGGLWERFDPMEYAHIDAFRSSPERVWQMVRELYAILGGAAPNPGHIGLGDLERLGLLRSIITQNVDGLHQRAGNTDVIEFHGSNLHLVCLSCDRRYAQDEAQPTEADPVPRCACGAILKPDVVFFGEPIPPAVQVRAQVAARQCNVMLMVGTSATVFPASQIPFIAKQNDALLIEINLEPTPLTDSVTDIFLPGSSSSVLPGLVQAVQARIR